MDKELYLSQIRTAFNRVLPSLGFFIRSGQVQMAEAIGEVFASRKSLAVEAGTGTGKSLAYLIPAMLLAATTKVRIVVATRTKNLQAQLVIKDAPLAADVVEQIVGKRIKFTLFKGKNNYLCPALLEKKLAAIQEDSAPNAEICLLRYVAAWFDTGGSGDIKEVPAWPDISLRPAEQAGILARISAGDDAAVCRGCHREFVVRCPFQQARQAAAEADIIVANHSVVATDFRVWRITRRARVLKGEPLPTVLVLDEAHGFEDAVRSVYETSFSPVRYERFASDILDLFQDVGHAAVDAAPLRKKKVVDEEFENSKKTIEYLRREAGVLAKDLAETGRAALVAERGTDDGVRLPLVPDSEVAKEIAEEAKRFLHALDMFFHTAVEAMYKLGDPSSLSPPVEDEIIDEDEPDWSGVSVRNEIAWRLQRLKTRNEELILAVHRACLLKSHYLLGGNDAVWLEPARGGVRFCAAPVDVREMLRNVWALYPGGMVLTSATLFPGRGQDAQVLLLEEMALPAETLTLEVPSPFNYRRLARCVVVKNSELNPDGDANCRVACLADAVRRIHLKVSGGVLVLFTSYQEMRAVATRLRQEFDGALLVQGEASRQELIEQFKKHGRAVLLGVDSFWQGVDVPGDALKAVVIAKLPFVVPDDPIYAAKAYMLREAGDDGFIRLALPMCAMRLRQGFGRLIRKETDSGWVYVLDPRLATKSYRRFLRRALPVPVEEIVVKFPHSQISRGSGA